MLEFQKMAEGQRRSFNEQLVAVKENNRKKLQKYSGPTGSIKGALYFKWKH